MRFMLQAIHFLFMFSFPFVIKTSAIEVTKKIVNY